MPGMRDVAKAAGVSLSTVSAVLSDSGKYVSEEIRSRVLETAGELGYQLPERQKKRDKIIAVVLPNIASTFFSNLLNGIEDTVAEEGTQISILIRKKGSSKRSGSRRCAEFLLILSARLQKKRNILVL